MKRIYFSAVIGVASFALFTHAGCVGSSPDASVANDSAAVDGTPVAHAEALRLRFRPRPPRPPVGTAGRPTGTGGSTATASCAAPTGSVEPIIAAAQTPDGRAIPQASLPGGCCPKVVAALGFWSCSTIGDACMYSTGGTVHHCICNRVDGEGQLPAWVCE